MTSKTPKELSEEFKFHSDKSLEHFKQADKLYQSIKDMPRNDERSQKLDQVLDMDSEAIAEAEKSMALTDEFLDDTSGK